MTVMFRFVRWALGVLLAAGSHMSACVQSQLGRDFIFVAESGDGVARS